MIDADQALSPSRREPAPWVFDLLLGIGVTLTVSLFIAADINRSEPDLWAYLWAVGLGALMLVRRRYPVTVVILSVVGVVTYYAAGYPAIGVGVPLAAAMFSAAEFGRVATAVIASTAVLAISVFYRLAIGQDPGYVGYELPGHALLLAGAIALGDSVRSRRELRRQSERIAELTRERYVQEAEQRVMSERLALARDLHDSVGHALAVVTLHTQVLEEAVGSEDEDVRRSLTAIAETTAATFSDLRRTVTGLREHTTPERSPLRLSDLDTATRPARDAGIEVRTHLHLSGSPSTTVEAAVYRIVQEAITNVVRHAEATRVDVDVRDSPHGMIEVSVVNDDRRRPLRVVPGEGNGIAGMRERVLLLGGRFFAGTDGQGFVVTASLPREVDR